MSQSLYLNLVESEFVNQKWKTNQTWRPNLEAKIFWHISCHVAPPQHLHGVQSMSTPHHHFFMKKKAIMPILWRSIFKSYEDLKSRSTISCQSYEDSNSRSTMTCHSLCNKNSRYYLPSWEKLKENSISKEFTLCVKFLVYIKGSSSSCKKRTFFWWIQILVNCES